MPGDPPAATAPATAIEATNGIRVVRPRSLESGRPGNPMDRSDTTGEVYRGRRGFAGAIIPPRMAPGPAFGTE